MSIHSPIERRIFTPKSIYNPFDIQILPAYAMAVQIATLSSTQILYMPIAQEIQRN